MTYHIPSIAIKTTARRKTEIKEIVSRVEEKYTSSKIDSIVIENFGTIEKVTAVVVVDSKKVDMTYTVDKKTKEVILVQEYTIPEVKGEYYSEETNKYGEVTIVSNNVKEITSKVSTVETGIQYIENKYPAVIDKPVEVVKVVEYPESYQINYVSKIDEENSYAVVVEVNKETKETVEISTYTKDDVETVEVVEPEVTIMPVVEEVPQKEEVTEIVKYLEQSKEISVRKIKSVTKVDKKTTVFGSEIVTIQGVSDQGEIIKTEVVFNPVTKDIVVNTFDIVEKKVVKKEIVTEFNVDMITGTKVTVTTNPTVLASSEIMKEITKEVIKTKETLEQTVLTSSTTTEYPDKVKVVSLYKDETSNEVTQVVSLFDKKTSKVEIVETERVSSSKTIATTDRSVFTSSEIVTAEHNYPSITTTLQFVEEQFPQISVKPSTVVVEPLEEVEFVSYIFEKDEKKTQVVTMYNKETKTTTVVESSPISVEIKPFYYE